MKLKDKLNSLLDTIQYEHGFDSPAYDECLKIKNLILDDENCVVGGINPLNRPNRANQLALRNVTEAANILLRETLARNNGNSHCARKSINLDDLEGSITIMNMYIKQQKELDEVQNKFNKENY